MRNVRAKILQLTVMAWFIATPVFWHMDLFKGSPGNYDILGMAPFSFFHLAVFYALMLVAFYVQKYSLFNILLLTLYYPMILFTNYPYLTYHDVYLHAGPAKNIFLSGNVNSLSISTLTSAQAKYWPGSFIYHALSSAVTGLDLIASNYLLYFGLSLALALVLYSLAKTLRNKGYSWAWLCPVLFLALFNNQFFEFNHYARTHIAFILFLFFLWVTIRFESRAGAILQIVIMATVVFVHPFQSLYVVLLLFCFGILSMLIHTSNPSKYTLASLFSSVAFFGWWLFQAGPSLETAVDFGRTIFTPQFMAPLAQTLPAPTLSLPIWGLALRDYFRWSLIMIVLTACLCSAWIVLRRKRGPVAKSEIVMLISSLAVSLIFLVVFLAIPGYGIGRFVAFASFPAAFSAVVCLNFLGNRKTSSLVGRRTATVFLLIFVISLSATTMMLRFESNYYLGRLVHPSELSSLSFAYSEGPHPLTITMSGTASLFYDYFDYDSVDKVTRYVTSQELASINEANLTEVLNLLKQNCMESNMVIMGLRDQYELSQISGRNNATMAEFESTILSADYSRIYSNGYYSVYSPIP